MLKIELELFKKGRSWRGRWLISARKRCEICQSLLGARISGNRISFCANWMVNRGNVDSFEKYFALSSYYSTFFFNFFLNSIRKHKKINPN